MMMLTLENTIVNHKIHEVDNWVPGRYDFESKPVNMRVSENPESIFTAGNARYKRRFELCILSYMATKYSKLCEIL